MNQRGSASRGELTKAMGATIQAVRKHEMQIAAMLEGIKQLMDGQAALGESFDELRVAVEDLKTSVFGDKAPALVD